MLAQLVCFNGHVLDAENGGDEMLDPVGMIVPDLTDSEFVHVYLVDCFLHLN